jgi:hypothetical protein
MSEQNFKKKQLEGRNELGNDEDIPENKKIKVDEDTDEDIGPDIDDELDEDTGTIIPFRTKKIPSTHIDKSVAAYNHAIEEFWREKTVRDRQHEQHPTKMDEIKENDIVHNGHRNKLENWGEKHARQHDPSINEQINAYNRLVEQYFLDQGICGEESSEQGSEEFDKQGE